MLLQAVPVIDDAEQPFAVAGSDMQVDPRAHAQDSHIAPRRANPFRTLPSGFIHSHVRRFKQQAQ
jgi:hypothetical protein